MNDKTRFYGPGFSSVDLNNSDLRRLPFCNWLEQKCESLVKTNLKLQKIWVNINPKNGYQARHVHSEFEVAGTYYIDVPTNSGDLLFYHPSPHVESMNRLKPFWDFTHRVVVKEGDLVLWPGYLQHEVTANNTNDLRVSVSFCFGR